MNSPAIQEMIANNKRNGGHFFDADTVQRTQTILHGLRGNILLFSVIPELYDGKEWYDGPRSYRLAYYNAETGRIQQTDFNAETLEEAEEEAERLPKLATTFSTLRKLDRAYNGHHKQRSED